MLKMGALGDSSIASLLRLTLPNGGYVLAMAQAFFDESGTGDDSPFLCVAGYIFTEENAIAIERPWGEMLKKYRLPYFHMTECNQHSGIYGHLTEAECIAAATEAIELTKLYAERGVAISIEKTFFDSLPPQDLWGHPYSLLCNNVMFGVVKWAKESGFDGDMSYFYESGAAGWSRALEAMMKIQQESAVPRDGLRFQSVTLVSKKKAMQLQCADLLAWNWHKQMVRESRGIKKSRGDFNSLRELKCDLHHFNQAALDKWKAAGSPTSSDFLS